MMPRQSRRLTAFLGLCVLLGTTGCQTSGMYSCSSWFQKHKDKFGKMFKNSKHCNVCQPEGIYYPVQEYPVETYDGILPGSPQVTPQLAPPAAPQQAVPNASPAPAPAALPNPQSPLAGRYGTTPRPSVTAYGTPSSPKSYHSQVPITVPMQSQSTFIPRPQPKPQLLNLGGIGHKMKSAFSSMSDKLKIRRTSASTAVEQKQQFNNATSIEQRSFRSTATKQFLNVNVVGTPPSQRLNSFNSTTQAGPSQVARNPLSVPTVTYNDIENWPYARTSDRGLELNSPLRQ